MAGSLPVSRPEGPVAGPVAGPGGVTFRAPEGWSLSRREEVVRLVAPDDDFTLAVVCAGEAADAGSAAVAVWSRYDGRPVPSVRMAAEEPPSAGWEARRLITYDPPSGGRGWLQAHLLRAGGRWTALILDGAKAAYERRGGAIATTLQSLSPPGHARESLAGRRAAPLDAERIEALKAFVVEAMATLRIPGVALALVDGGEVAFTGGFGVRALGEPAPVDADTRFLIASCTKPLTTLMLAKLVDEGVIGWDQRAQDILPEFALADAELASRLRVRDLLSASTGLPRKDFAWAFTFTAATPAARALELLAGVAPTTPFGEAFQYNNLVAAAAGYVGGRAAYPGLELGAAYDRAMLTRVFRPLGMARTTFDCAVAQDGGHARPHATDARGETVAVDPALNAPAHALRPSGGAWSTVRDLAAYVQAELAMGLLPGGKRFVSQANLRLRRTPVVTIGAEGAYGIGLYIDTASDVTVVRHGGSMPGFASDVFVLPEAGIGAVVLANAEAGGVLVQAVKRRLLELLYDGEPQAQAMVGAAVARREAEAAAASETLDLPPLRAAAGALAPRYRSPDLGLLRVDRAGDEVRLRFASGGARVGLRRDDGALVSVEPGLRGLVFERDGDDGLMLRDGQHDYRYVADRS